MLTPAKVRRLNRPAVSSWSRLKRSSDSARTTSNRRFSASRVFLRDRPTLPLSERAAHAHLIGDRRVPLVVRGIARVDADFHGFTSMDDRCVASKLRLERFARRLPRQNSYERAKHIVAFRINRHGCSATNDWRNTSSSLASFASSFGHDTPAHVERRLAIRGVRDGDEWAALSAAPNASRLASSAEGVFGAAIARRHSQRDLIKRSESGSCRNEALERHSEALHIGRCGGRAVRHERDVSNIRLVASAVNGDQTSTIAQMPDQAERRRGQRPQAVRNARSERKRRALTPPSTA